MKTLVLFAFFLIIISCNRQKTPIPKVKKYPISLVGKAIKIVDGDTFDVRIKDSATIRIRLASIDTPEKTQEFYQVAKDALANFIFGKEVYLTVTGTDRYKRLVAIVLIDGKNVNLAMVQSGFAWQYLKYDTSELYKIAEEEARNNKLGLWVTQNPESPWVFKAREKMERSKHQ